MGVYIKGMEMPKSCNDCPLNYDSIDCMVADIALRKKGGGDFLYEHERASHCPLVPVPPHGRLIDADALHEELYALEYARENEWFDGVREAQGVDAARVALLDAPTIIPAEEGE